MKFGFIASHVSATDAVQLAVEAEQAGWDGIFTWDGIGIAGLRAFDPWVLLGAMAGATERITLGAMIFPLARRRPWKVAKEAVTIDHLSGGRLVIPVGLGVPEDRAFSGVNTDTPDRKTRAEQLDECLELLERFWTGEPVTYAGKHYQVDDMQLLPRPVNGRIPIWTVAAWPKPKSMARAVRLDGIIPADTTDPNLAPAATIRAKTVRDIAAWMREHRETDLPFDLVCEGTTSGDPATDRDTLQPLADAGATWFIESRWGETETYDTLVERIRQGPPVVE